MQVGIITGIFLYKSGLSSKSKSVLLSVPVRVVICTNSRYEVGKMIPVKNIAFIIFFLHANSSISGIAPTQVKTVLRTDYTYFF